VATQSRLDENGVLICALHPPSDLVAAFRERGLTPEVLRGSAGLTERLLADPPALLVVDMAVDDEEMRRAVRAMREDERLGLVECVLVSSTTQPDEVRRLLDIWLRRRSQPPER
jgi:hypothetical protein